MRHSSIAIAVFCVFLQLGAGLQPGYGLNLCIGADGHASIELAHADSECWSEVRRHHGTEGVGTAHELAEHPCTDIALSAERASRVRESRAPMPPAIRVLQRVDFRSVSGAWCPPAVVSSDVGDSALRALRTIVLTL